MVQTASAKTSKATKAGGRVNSIGHFIVDKIDGEVMRDFLKAQKVPDDKVDAEGPDEQVAVALSLFFRETTADDDMLSCDRCKGEAPATIENCPFCGLEGEAVDNGDASSGDVAAKAAPSTSDLEDEGDDEEEQKVTPASAEAPKKSTKKGKESMVAAGAAAAVNGASTKKSVKSTSTAIAKVANGEVLVSNADLDKSVRNVEKLKADASHSYWALGREILHINEKKLWKLRTDDKGKARYTNWDAFVHHELGMSPTHAYSLMEVAKNFSEADVRAFGTGKLSLILKAPPDARPSLLESAKKGTSKKKLSEAVQTARAERDYKSDKPQAKGGKAKAKKTAAKAKASAQDKVSIAQIAGRTTLKLFAKPDSIRDLDMSALKRAKTIDAVPFGRHELTNEVVQFFTIQKTDKGLVLVIDTRRESTPDAE